MSPPTRTTPQYTDETARSCIEFDIPSHEFVLAETVSELDAAAIALVSTPDDSESERPLIRIRGANQSDIETAFFEEPDIEAWARLNTRGSGWLYQPSWSKRAHEQLGVLLSDGAVLEEAIADGAQWSLRMTLPTRTAVRELYDRCDDHGLTIAVTHLYEQTNTERR